MDSQASIKMLFDEIISRHVSILGPDITYARVKHVPEIQLTPAGKVAEINGEGEEVLGKLINQFVDLSGLIVKKTLESIVAARTQQDQVTATEMMHQAHLGQDQVSPMPKNDEMVAAVNKALSSLTI